MWSASRPYSTNESRRGASRVASARSACRARVCRATRSAPPISSARARRALRSVDQRTPLMLLASRSSGIAVSDPSTRCALLGESGNTFGRVFGVGRKREHPWRYASAASASAVQAFDRTTRGPIASPTATSSRARRRARRRRRRAPRPGRRASRTQRSASIASTRRPVIISSSTRFGAATAAAAP